MLLAVLFAFAPISEVEPNHGKVSPNVVEVSPINKIPVNTLVNFCIVSLVLWIISKSPAEDK